MADDIVKRLRERTTLRYMADCKCGKCQLVHINDMNAAADRIAALEAENKTLREMALGFMGVKPPGTHDTIHHAPVTPDSPKRKREAPIWEWGEDQGTKG